MDAFARASNIPSACTPMPYSCCCACSAQVTTLSGHRSHVWALDASPPCSHLALPAHLAGAALLQAVPCVQGNYLKNSLQLDALGAAREQVKLPAPVGNCQFVFNESRDGLGRPELWTAPPLPLQAHSHRLLWPVRPRQATAWRPWTQFSFCRRCHSAKVGGLFQHVPPRASPG